MTWLVVHNPTAGRGEVGAEVADCLDRTGVDHSFVTAESTAGVARHVEHAVERGVRRFAAVGGDGTLNVVLNAVLAHPWEDPPTLALLPSGSGSDFIRTFALPRSIEEMAPKLATGEPYRCDIGRIRGTFGDRYFLNVADVGVAAASVRYAALLPRLLGGLRYRIAFWLALAGLPTAPVVVDVGRRPITGKAINIVIANAQFFGGGINIAPQAALMDGLLDVEVFIGPRRQAFTVMPRVVRGTHLRHAAVTVRKGAAVTVQVPDHWPVEADGELLGSGSVTVECVPAAVDFVI